MEFQEMKSRFETLMVPVTDEPHKCNPEKCKRCSQQGITCCEHLPCYISPDDVKDKTLEGLCALIDTGAVSLDWWEGDPNLTDEENMKIAEGTNFRIDETYKGYFLRMRGDNRPIVQPAIGLVECIMLTDDGCALSFCHRPKGGRELIPGENVDEFGGCHSDYDKQVCAIEWHPYHDVLHKLYVKYYLENPIEKIKSDADFMASMITHAFFEM